MNVNRSTHMFISLLLLFIVIVMPLSSCQGDFSQSTDLGEDQSTQDSTPEDTQSCLPLWDENTKYTLILPTDSSSTESDAAYDIKSAIYSTASKLTLIKNDKNEALEHEIIIGATTRPESMAAAELLGGNRGYVIMATENKIVIYTSSDSATQAATDFLIENYLKTGKDIPKNLMITDMKRDIYRPYFHYTPKENMLADPNGLLYNAVTGEYHLYHQHSDYIIRDNKRPYWGHAVSKDLINWTTAPTAISESTWCLSGCGVIDHRNVTGFFDSTTTEDERIVVFFTSAHNGVSTQKIAYSKDGGYTFKIVDKPVLSEAPTEGGWRDPKVIWVEDSSHKNGGYYLMIIGGKYVHLYTSDSLLDWDFQSTLRYTNQDLILSECPDIFPLKVEGEDRTLWVLLLTQAYYGQGSNYLVGELVEDASGKLCYKPIQARITFNSGKCGAMQSYYNSSDGRRLIQAWSSERTAPSLVDKEWNGIMTMAVEATLKKDGGVYRMYLSPAKENYAAFKTSLYELKNAKLTSSDENPLKDIEADAALISGIFDMSNSSSVTFTVREGNGVKTSVSYSKASKTLTVNTTSSGVGDEAIKKSYSLPVTLDSNNMLKLEIFLDNTILEVFANDGQAYITADIFPPQTALGMSISTEGELSISELTVSECTVKQ